MIFLKDDYGKPLTPGQKKLLPLVADGLSNEQIARLLGITIGTVKVHLCDVCGRVGVTNRAALAVWYVRMTEVPGAKSPFDVHLLSGYAPVRRRRKPDQHQCFVFGSDHDAAVFHRVRVSKVRGGKSSKQKRTD